MGEVALLGMSQCLPGNSDDKIASSDCSASRTCSASTVNCSVLCSNSYS